MRTPAERAGGVTTEHEETPVSEGRSLRPPAFSLTADPPPSDGGGDGGSTVVQRQESDGDGGGAPPPLSYTGDSSTLASFEEGADSCSVATGADHVICDLIAMGVDEDELGSISALDEVSRWADYETIHALLIRVNAGGRRLGGAGRLVRAWNAHLDDLGITAGGAGPTRETPYATLFHYGRELNRLSLSSTGEASYLDAMTEEHMPPVRIAGVRTGVHYRAVYLAAAAQVRMDELGRDGAGGEHDGGEGHYIPVGGFRIMVADIQNMLGLLGSSDAVRRRGPGPRRADIPEHGPEALATMHGELLHMLDVIEQQAATMEAGEDTGEHIEPGMSSYFLGIADQLRAFDPATSVEEVPASARELAALIGPGLPGSGETHHGFGSVDPHGTDHAMGLAVDIYNGRGREGTFQNFGIREEYWPFVHFLIREAGSSLEHLDPNIAPDAVHELEPEAARELARLLSSEHAMALGQEFHDRAVELRRRRRGDVSEEEAARERRETAVTGNTRRMYNALLGRVRRALRDRIHIFNQLRASRSRTLFSGGEEGLQNEIVAIFNTLRDAVSTVGDLSPAQLQSRLEELHARLGAFQALASRELAKLAENELEDLSPRERELAGMSRRERRASMAGMRNRERQTTNGRLSSLDRSRSRREEAAELVGGAYAETDSLSGLAASIADGRGLVSDEELENMEEDAPLRTRGEGREEVMDLDQAFATDAEAEILEFAGTNVFLRWLEYVRRRPVYDQSEIMVAGFDSVRAFDGAERTHEHTHFYGGHHWTVAPREELLGSDAGYQNVIYRDMHDRPHPQIERILQIMAESEGGRGILFGGGAGATDPSFPGGDRNFRQVLERVLGGDMATAMLGRVYSRVVESYGDSSSVDGRVMEMMRDRGFYLLDDESDGAGIVYAVSDEEVGHE